jgi:hypothetical protein
VADGHQVVHVEAGAVGVGELLRFCDTKEEAIPMFDDIDLDI